MVAVLNRPDKKNAFSPEMLDLLRNALQTANDDPAIGCMVITGAGDAFCSGGDLGRRSKDGSGESPTPLERKERLQKVTHKVALAIEAFEKPFQPIRKSARRDFMEGNCYMNAQHTVSRFDAGVVLAFVLLMLGVQGQVSGQDFPNKAVRIVAPFPPGGATDINVRRLSERLNKSWGQPVIVDNVAGAAGIVAAATVAKSKADGYTLFFITHPILSINPLLYDKLPYNADNDFSPVVEVSETPSVLLVCPALQVASVSELISVAKAKPGTLLFGSGGVGTTLHLSGELFKAAAGIDIVHVPYKGGAPALTALISNEIQLSFDSSSSALRQIHGGRLRGLAVASVSRLSAAPTLPTFMEGGLNGVVSSLGNGIVVPTGTPRSTIASINIAVNSILKNDDYRKTMVDDGVQVVGGPPEQFGQFLANERKKWQVLIQKLAIKAQ